jgi:DNA-binding GntR family transcriptional regulator
MNGPALGVLNRAPPLAEQIYAMVRRRLRSGALPSGERLVEASLARAFGVSRSPVREALARLAADGLLEAGDNGFSVPVPTLASMEEIFDVRRLIEPPAASRAAAGMNEPAAERLRAAVELARHAQAAGERTAFLEANYLFRSVWVARLANSRLREVILRFDDQAGTVRCVTLADGAARREALDLLEEGLEAFAAKNGEAAERFALSFIDGAARYFRRIAAGTQSSDHNASTESQGEFS